MKKLLLLSILAHTALADESPKANTRPRITSPRPQWHQVLDAQIERLGHRNLIIIADSAYPIQTGNGVTVITTGADHRDVVAYALRRIAASPAVRPLVALDKEFQFVPDERAPGATKLRAELLALLEGKSHEPIREELHEKLLQEVSERAKDFAVVVFKTTGTIPYSSVFLTLDCGYWTADDEAALRKAMDDAE